MTKIRRFAYATLLAVTTLNLAPSLASAQEPARGRFTLPHDVHWGSAQIPAGDYEFNFDPYRTSPMLSLSKVSGARAGFMMRVPTIDEAKSSDMSRLVLKSTPEGSYVSAMELPEFGMTLYFSVPPHPTERQVAKVVTATSASQ